MSKLPQVTPAQKEILGRFAAEMQESGCDAVIVIGTSTKNNKTKSFVAQFGNELLCNSLIHHAFQTETIIYADEEVEEDE
tara:strand:+ start:79 stop:318 length:240 start_codon:yes stop_codon:yes gene_type:complete